MNNTLIIGGTVRGTRKSISWLELCSSMPTLADYASVIINLPAFKSNALLKLDFDALRKKIFEALTAGTTIHIISAERVSVGNTNSYEFLPFEINYSPEKGEVFLNKPDNEYFRKVKKWNFHLKFINSESTGGKKIWYYVEGTKTRHHYDIAFSVELMTERGGFITFYPQQTNTSVDENLANLVKFLHPPEDESVDLPEFINDMVLPGEKDLIKKNEEDNTLIKEAGQRVKTNTDKLRGLTSTKGILAFKGKSLEKVVFRVLAEMGIGLSDAEKYEEDKTFDKDGNKIPIEVKGHNKGMQIDDIRQIVSRGKKVVVKKGIPVMGILIGNPYAETELNKRGTDFEPNHLKMAKPFGICLISTTTIFKFWIDYLRSGKTELADKLLHTVGILKFEPQEKKTPNRLDK